MFEALFTDKKLTDIKKPAKTEVDTRGTDQSETKTITIFTQGATKTCLLVKSTIKQQQ